MATIRSYTSLEQSKKLAEILPIESADMHYNVVGDAIIGDYQSGISNARSVAKAYKKNPDEFAKNVIPCWSLAALLNYLREIDFVPEIDANEFSVTMNINFYEDEEAELLSLAAVHNIKVKAESFIDACVEMILKLHEQKLL